MTTPALYVREGSRFVLYDPKAQHVPPIPVPRPLHDVVEDDPRPNVHRVAAARCEHGHFAGRDGRGRGCARCGRGAPARRGR